MLKSLGIQLRFVHLFCDEEQPITYVPGRYLGVGIQWSGSRHFLPCTHHTGNPSSGAGVRPRLNRMTLAPETANEKGGCVSVLTTGSRDYQNTLALVSKRNRAVTEVPRLGGARPPRPACGTNC